MRTVFPPGPFILSRQTHLGDSYRAYLSTGPDVDPHLSIHNDAWYWTPNLERARRFHDVHSLQNFRLEYMGDDHRQGTRSILTLDEAIVMEIMES